MIDFVISGFTVAALAALLQAPSAPKDSTPVLLDCSARLDFEAEGSNWVRYTYRVLSR